MMGRSRRAKLKLTPKALERFEQIVPLDLSDEELHKLTHFLEPVGDRSIDDVLDNLEKSIASLPGRSATSADDVKIIKSKLAAIDWEKLPTSRGVFFRDRGPIGLSAGTKTSSFVYGFDTVGQRFGALVQIEVGKIENDVTPVTVLSSTNLYKSDGSLYASASAIIGKTFHVRKLSELYTQEKKR